MVLLIKDLPEHRRSPKHDRRSSVLDLSEHRRLPQMTADHYRSSNP